MRKTLFIFFAVFVIFLIRVQFLPKLDLKDGQLVKVTGVLSEEPQVLGNRQAFKIGQFEIWLDRWPEHHYGEEIEVVGKVKPLTILKLPILTLKTYLIGEAKIKVKTAAATSLMGKAISLRQKLRAIFRRCFQEPLDGLVSGIVLGDKTLLSKEFSDKLRLTGTIHIMVASGMNVSLIAVPLLSFLTLFLKKRKAILCSMVMMWFYCIVTGWQVPIIRASMLISLIYLARFLGKEAEMKRTLWLTGILMLFYNPVWIADLGFQLSFLSTLGLVYLQPKLQTSGWAFLAWESVASTLAATLFTLPVLVASFGRLNLASPLINLLILWSIPYIFGLGILVGFFGLLWIKLAVLASYLAYPLLYFLEQSINLFAKMRFSQMEVPRMSLLLVVVYYVFLFYLARNVRHT